MTEEAPTTRRRWFTRPVFIAAVAVLILVGAGVAFTLRSQASTKDSPLNRLRRTDGSGAAACEYLSQWIRGKVLDPSTHKPYDYVVVSVAVSEEAIESTTPRIKAAVGDPVTDSQTLALLQAKTSSEAATSRVTNLTYLYQACSSAGVPMPPFSQMPH